MTKAAKPAGPPPSLIVNSATAPTVYADGALGFIEAQGNLRITFATFHGDHSGNGGPPAHVVSLRLVLPTIAAEELAEKLLSYAQSTRAISKAKTQPPASPAQ
jgi:hypothetical protein